MNSSVLLARKSPAIILGFLLSASAVRGGIMDILKGPPEPPPKPVWQRVAFIGEAQVKSVQGKAERLAGIDRWQSLQPGGQLRPGDVIRTTDRASVVLQMVQSGSLVRMTERTVLRLTPFEEGWDKGVLSGKEEKQGYCVRSLRGKAFFQTEKGKWQRMTVNSVLPEGTVVRTDTQAHLDLFHCASGKFVRIYPGAQVQLREASELAARTLRSPTVVLANSAAAIKD